jgi:hypothetical protein
LARPAAEFVSDLISISIFISISNSDWTKRKEIDLDQFPGREAVISKAGIRSRESYP